jgi:hypothetical protein
VKLVNWKGGRDVFSIQCTCTHTHTHAHTHTHTHTHAHTHLFTHTYKNTHSLTHLLTHIHTGDDILATFGFSTSDSAYWQDVAALSGLCCVLLLATFLLLKYRVGRI